jgi:uncharacterized membrane protein
MRKVFAVLMFLLMVFSVLVFYGCGTQGQGGGGTSDENLIKMQMASLMAAVASKNTTEALAIFSNKFRLTVEAEGEILVFDKATIESGLAMIKDYLDAIEIDLAECPNPQVTVYPDGIISLSADKGAKATVEGLSFIKLHTIAAIPLPDFGAVSVASSLKALESSGSPMEALMAGTYASARVILPLIFTKEATTGTQSDWKIVGINIGELDGPPTDILKGMVATMPGTQSAFSIGMEATIESSLSNENFVLVRLDEWGPLISIGLNPGISANTTYNPVLDFDCTWGATDQFTHTYKTRAAGAGSGHVTGEVTNATSGKKVGLYLVPKSVVDGFFGAAAVSSIKSKGIKALQAINPMEPGDGAEFAAFISFVGGSYSVRSIAVNGQGTTKVNYDITGVANGDYVLIAMQWDQADLKIAFGITEGFSGGGAPWFTVSGGKTAPVQVDMNSSIGD